MKRELLIIILIFCLIAPLATVLPVLAAAGDVLIYTDQTITFSSPSTNLTILASSTVDKMIINAASGTIDFTISGNGSTTLRSSDRKTISFSSTSLADDYVTITCNSNVSAVEITGLASSVDGATFKITVGSGTCATGESTVTESSGGGGGGSAAAAPAAAAPAPAAPAEEEVPAEEEEVPAAEEAAPAAEVPATVEEEVSTTPGVPATIEGRATLGQMTADATTVASGDVNQVIAEMGVSRDASAEINYNETIVEKVVGGSGITAQVRNTVTNFVTYGTPATKILGAGERAGVVNSYRSAFNKVPTTAEEWNDVVKIANGRWPTARSTAKEDKAKTSFRTIYLRSANMDDPNDNAAVTVMAYGLRPADRNLDSERNGIKFFKGIFGYNPTSASNWDAVRAIAYSGATR